MLSLIHAHPKLKNGLFFLGLAIVASFFLWSRLDFSDRIYYSGDGDVIVGLIQLILQSHNWDVDWNRLIGVLQIPEELKPFASQPDLTRRFYNLSGYTIIGAVICKIIYAAGFAQISIQKILHGFNAVLQLGNLLLLFFIGQKIANRYLGLLAVFFLAAFPLAMMEAHYERPESWLCLLTTAIIYFSIEFEKNIKSNSAWIGALIGLSIVTKFTQIYLGIIPAVLMANYLFSAGTGKVKQRLMDIFTCSVILLLSMFVAAFINTPCIFENFFDYLSAIPDLQKFYATPAYPFAEEHYDFFQQLRVILRYFYLTLGAGWLFCFAWGVGAMLTTGTVKNNPNRSLALVVILPIVFLSFLFAMQVNFIERNFASVEGLIALLSGMGLYYLVMVARAAYLKAPALLLRGLSGIPASVGGLFITAMLLSAVFYPSLKLDYLFVKNHINQPSYSERIKFQNELKKDFPGMWIKNVYITFNILNKIPEHMDGPPRIYHVEDLNEASTRDYLLNLKRQGFISVAEYCSDFYYLPPTDFTIYHARARDHYLIKDNELPKDVAQGYFRTNCK